MARIEYSPQLRLLFNKFQPPVVNLAESIELAGLSISTLRQALLENSDFLDPESIFHFPPWTAKVSKTDLEFIFAEGKIKLEKSYIKPRHFSTIFAGGTEDLTYAHCLITYEKISANLIEQSKSRRSALNYPFEANISEKEPVGYTPIVICILTKTTYIDFFYEALQVLYKLLKESVEFIDGCVGNISASLEFLKFSCLLVENAVVPPVNTSGSISIGNYQLEIPYAATGVVPENESCILTLFELIDVGKIISVWEVMMFGMSVVCTSSNHYLLFLIQEAFKLLLFPVTWGLSTIPLLPSKKIEYIGSPVPFIIGLDKNQINIQQLILVLKRKMLSQNSEESKEDPIPLLDIDQNEIYNTKKILLCECFQKKMTSKIQYAKSYFSGGERKRKHGTSQWKQGINDPFFIEKVKIMGEITDQKAKTKAYIEVLRDVFLDVFRSIGDINEIIEINEEILEFDISISRLTEKIVECKQGECGMRLFWEQFCFSQNVKYFFGFYKRIDSDNPLTAYEQLTVPQSLLRNFHFDIKQQINSLDFINFFIDISNDFLPKNALEEYSKETLKILSKKLKEILSVNTNYYDSSRICGVHKLPKKHGKDLNIFYGEFGIVKVANVLTSLISQKSFEKYYSVYKTFPLTRNSCEELLIEFNFLVKPHPDAWDLSKLIDLCILINEISPAALPLSYTVIILDKAYLFEREIFKKVLESEGKLKEFINLYYDCIDRPESFFKQKRKISIVV